MASSPRQLPARRADLLTRELDGEFVVVDEAADQAHQLSGDVALVWRAAETGEWPALPDEQADEIVAELIALGLLAEAPGLTRRAMIQRGGALVALTGLATISLPAASAFASTVVAPTTPTSASGTVTIPASTDAPIRNLVVNLLAGAGAGTGALVTAAAGGRGAAATITFPGKITSPVTLTWIIGQAGTAATGGTAAGGSAGGNGGNGGTGSGSGGASGGGGGGASSVTFTGGLVGTVYVGGGGGASGSGSATSPGVAGSDAPTTAGTGQTVAAGGTGGNATPQGNQARGGGGGGGAGAPAGAGGTGSATTGVAGGAGAAGGTSSTGLTAGTTVSVAATSTGNGSISYSYVQGP